MFGADAVGGDDRHDVADGVAHHRTPPQPRGVEAGIVRLATDRGGVEQQFRPHQHHRARGLGIPLIPAYADAQRPSGRGLRRRPHLEPRVAGAEVELFLIARAVRDVALAIDALDFAIGADHRQAVVVMRPVRFEEAGRDRHLQRLGQRLHRQHGLVLSHRRGIGEQPFVLDAAEIFALEQFGRQDHLRALPRRFAHQARDVGDVRVDVVRKGELQRGDGDGGHDGSYSVTPNRAATTTVAR